MARWDNENFHTEVPSTGILCSNCQHRLPDIQIGERVVNRAGYGSCKKYTLKPQDVLWNGAYCPKYRKE